MPLKPTPSPPWSPLTHAFLLTHTHTQIYLHPDLSTPRSIHTQIYTCAHTQIFTHIHTHTHTVRYNIHLQGDGLIGANETNAMNGFGFGNPGKFVIPAAENPNFNIANNGTPYMYAFEFFNYPNPSYGQPKNWTWQKGHGKVFPWRRTNACQFQTQDKTCYPFTDYVP